MEKTVLKQKFCVEPDKTHNRTHDIDFISLIKPWFDLFPHIYIFLLQVFKAAQPALLYLVPFTMLPLCLMAYLKGDLKTMWHEPFASKNYVNLPKYQDI